MHGPGGLRRDVALKVLRSGSGALWREARIGGLLRHRNLLDVYEVGEDDGVWFCAMERCDSALASWGTLPPRAVVEVGIAVCDALQYAHEELGLVHLDLKPENLLIRDGVVKVADLGIARAQGFEHDGRIRGTRGFMAPEQTRGEPVDAKADVWALGVTLLELAGAGAADASTTMSLTLGQTATTDGIANLTTDQAFTGDGATLTLDDLEVPEPRDRDGSGAARWLTPVVESCFAVAPADRPTMGELREALQALELRGPDLRGHLGIDARPLPGPDRAETNLPDEMDVFVGRQSELGRIEQALERPGLLTLKGPGGVGKSRLATTAARRWRTHHGGQAWFCDLANARSRNGLVTAVARTLHIPLGRRDAVLTLGRAIAGRGDAVFVLDNFEQIVDLADVVDQWRTLAPRARFVVTSRVPLALDGEVVMPLEVLSAEDACALLVARARSRGADIAADPDVARLAARLEGLPLALELAAGRLGVLAVRDVLERLDQGILRSSGADRHATLTATLDWSWDLLEPADRLALAQLSVFAGSFSLEAAEAVLRLPQGTTVLQSVDRLAHHSLVVGRGERFALLVSIQAYANERLTEAADAELRHSAWSAHLNNRLGPPGSTPRLRGLTEELMNLVAACHRATALGDGAHAVATVEACWEVLAMLGPFAEAIELAEAVCALPLAPPLAARAAKVAGSALRAFGDMDAAVGHHLRALDLYKGAGDRFGQAVALDHLGELAAARGQFEEACERYEACISLPGIRPRDRITGLAKGHLGLVLHYRGELDRAKVLYEEALGIYRAAGDRRAEGVTRGNLGILHRAAGRPEQAAAHYDAALAIHREIGDRGLEGVLLGNLGVLHGKMGNIAREQACYQRALAIHRELGNRRSEGVVLSNLAELHAGQGDAERASTAYARALVLHREVENRRMEGLTLAQLARLDAAAGNLQRARGHLDDGETVLRAGNHRTFLAELLATRASVEALAGDLDAARAALSEAEAEAPEGHTDVETALERARAQIALASPGAASNST